MMPTSDALKPPQNNWLRRPTTLIGVLLLHPVANTLKRKYTPKCQIYDELGHIAKHCPCLRFAESTANYVATSPATNPKWLIDSRASHNITGDLANLSIHSEYDDTDEVVIGQDHGDGSTQRHVLFDESQTHPLLRSVETQVPAMSILPVPPVPLTLLLQPLLVPMRGNAIFASSLEPMVVHDDHHSDPPLPHFHRIHTMTTRSMNNIHKPKQFNSVTKHPLPPTIEPTCVGQALCEPHWRHAMSNEPTTLMRHGSWDLVSPPKNCNPVGCKWVFV
ncbi:hypothetical protein CK203_030796 [Vitis vinifera]|uniref:Retrovirus-related Pol polyprotein from transposon RE2 n=1 Tax=Vitis vinifera TaxID=29760 RepID=A0A438ICV9_VITVI|nr:hypothetical protein CK203_030796 [Vitis vinifera]